MGTGEPYRDGLREVLARSGDLPVFGRPLLDVMRWAAVHYVAPLAALLGKATPPNLPRGGGAAPGKLPGGWPASPLPQVTAAGIAGRKGGAVAWIGSGPRAEVVAAVAGPVVEAGRSALVVAASMAEASAIADALEPMFGRRMVRGGPERSAAQLTTAWVAMQRPGRILVSTREAAFWPVTDLGVAFVADDGRRGLKDKATPTTHARDVLRRRAAVERFPLVLTGPVPTSEALGAGATVDGSSGRAWGLVEVVDRTEDPPGGGVITERARAALHAVVGGGGRAFVFTDRRAPAVRCIRCRTLRSCPECGARPGREAACARCGAELGDCRECGGRRFEPLGAPVDRLIAELRRFLAPDRVGEAGSDTAVQVGTERDLPTLGPIDLAVVVDADGLIRAPHYRAVEDGFRLMARVVAAAGSGRGRRAVAQTADPGHPALVALRRAAPDRLIRHEIDTRAALGFPPHGELLVLEVTDPPADGDRLLRSAVGERATVLGPAERRGRMRWLIQGNDLRPARLTLRGLVQDWRDGGARVRVDADPIDL